MESLQVTDAQAAAVQKTPHRVSLESMEAKIAAEYYITGAEAALPAKAHPSLSVLMICIIVMRNGFTLIGKSAPADPANFNPALGMKFACEDAIRQLWPLEAYALRDRLADASH